MTWHLEEDDPPVTLMQDNVIHSPSETERERDKPTRQEEFLPNNQFLYSVYPTALPD